MFGRERVKPYQSQGTPMYFAVASHKQKYAVKIVTVLPEEKVRTQRGKSCGLHPNPPTNVVVACFKRLTLRLG